MKIMPLIAELPPRPRPLAHRIVVPEAVSATVVSAQSAEVPSRLGPAGGTGTARTPPRGRPGGAGPAPPGAPPPAGLQQQHTRPIILRQSRGDEATRRAG